ncbi:MAG TPA: RDD family protein [Allocoleopsis sp.]
MHNLHDLPRQKLREIIIQYGRSICDDPPRFEGLLRDLCGQYRKEISILVGALRERVPPELLSSQNTTPWDILLTRLTKRLQDNLGLSEEAAHWSVESWALALGVITSTNQQTSGQISQPSSQDRTDRPAGTYQPPPVADHYRQENIFQPQSFARYEAGGQLQANVAQTRLRAVEYAGFWKRFLAVIIDSIILYILGAIVGFIFGIIYTSATESKEGLESLAFLLGIIVGWLYFALQESSSKQATLGKQAIGIIVTDLNGERVSFGKATARHFGKIISLILLIGYLIVAFTEKKQALHDIMAGCLVVKK